MDVILKQDIDKLGLRGEVVNVARGYARNFLFPRGLAEVATPALVRELALLPYVAETAGGEDRPRGRGGRDRDRDDR